MKLNEHNFLKTITDYYINNIEKVLLCLCQNIVAGHNILEFYVNCLPKLEFIRKIIYQRLILKKELILIKIILDINENYYKSFKSCLFQVKK